MGIVTSTSETAFTQTSESVYDFVTSPVIWTKTYPGSMHIAMRPTPFAFTSVGGLEKRTQPVRKLTPAAAVRDTFAMICKGGSG